MIFVGKQQKFFSKSIFMNGNFVAQQCCNLKTLMKYKMFFTALIFHCKTSGQ